MNFITNNPTFIRQEIERRQEELTLVRRRTSRARGVRTAVATLGVIAVSLVCVDRATAAMSETFLVSHPQNAAADDYSDDASISADGRFVAFTSMATNLSDADGDGVSDVFVRDTREDTIILASRSNGPDGAGSQYDSFHPSISANGRFVAFASHEDGFTDEDQDGLDVFVRDLKANETVLVSRASGSSGAGGDEDSHSPSISANGRFVAFESNADNLDDEAEDVGNIFVRDLKRGKTTLVSRRSGMDSDGGDQSSHDPSISADGQRVAFDSSADNLSRSDNNGVANVFVHDLRSDRTTLASAKPGSERGADSDSVDAAISANGQHVAFESKGSNLATDFPGYNFGVFVRNLGTGDTALASRNAADKIALDNAFTPTISGGGRYIAFESFATNLSKEDSDPYVDIFVRDLARGRTLLASRASGAKGPVADGHSTRASISANGKYIAFGSEANNLSEADAPGIPDVFRRDLRWTKTTG